MPLAALPRIGLGTSSRDDSELWAERVRTALEVGYRHVDTAQVYGNEAAVGDGIATSDVDREEVFLATKTVHVDVPPRPGDVPAAIDGCLDRLGVDYVDLLYVHWPAGIYDPEAVLPAFDAAREAGTIRHVGVSNFTPEQFDAARAVLDAPVVANQVEMHPLCQQEDLVSWAQDEDVWLVAYSPLAKGAVFDVPEVRAVAEKHDATPAQVSLAWLHSLDNVAAIPKASSRAHMAENLAARDLELDETDRETIASIDREHRVIDPAYAPWNQ